MTTFKLEHKLRYLQSNVSAPTRAELETSFRSDFTRLKESYLIPPYIEGLLFLDLCYIAVRHRIWLHHPLLKETTAHFLTEEYRFASELSWELSESFLRNARAWFLPPTHEYFSHQNKHFLLYIFVHACNAKNQQALTADLGLGTGLLQRLQQAAQFLSNSQRQEQTVYFEADQDSEMIDVIAELAEKRASLSWVTDVYRLQFTLADPELNWDLWQNLQRTTTLLSFLLVVGQDGGLGLQEATVSLVDLLGVSEPTVKQVLAVLTRAQVLREWHAPLPSCRGQPPFVRLGAFGRDLTAEAFADSVKMPMRAEEFAKLPPAWQLAHLARFGSEQNAFLRECMAKNPRLDPAVLEFALSKIACSQSDKGVILDLIKMTEVGIPSVRAAAVKSLAHLKSVEPEVQDQIEKILARIGRDDPSASVREAARVPHTATAKTDLPQEIVRED